ncbi:hypothetical protein UP10_13450 [Bradyrhizobium sp. LTSPM299]|nr:hypothetical protein UP10_13450 [Bradyrhizobium sp. LTSPM299]
MAVTRGGSVALEEGKASFTWSSLARRARCAAAGLIACGIRPGDRVGILAHNSSSYIVVLHAIWLIDAIAVPLNWRLTQSEIIEQLEDSAVSAILADNSSLQRAEGSWPSPWRGRLLSMETDSPLFSRGSNVPEGAFDAEKVSAILYTGGTTGRSKGVKLSARSLVSNASVVSRVLGLKPEDRCLLTAPFFHIGGAGMILAATYAGAAQIPLHTFEPDLVIDCVRRHRITTVFLVPTMLQMLLRAPGFSAEAFTSLRNVFYGASPISEILLRRALEALPSVRFTQAYGQTEICPLTVLTHEDHLNALANDPVRLRSAGQAVWEQEIRVIGNDGKSAPTGGIGEIIARGPSAMDGYHNRPEETRTAIADGFVRTGDIGFFDEDGYLTLVDRARDMIVSRGENVYSTEVESVLGAHVNVGQVAVIGVPDAIWGERVHGVIVPKGELPTESELIAFCRERLAGYKCPKSIEFIGEMPLTGAGKIAKSDLRQRHWQNNGRAIS